MELFETFYNSQWQHPILLWVAAMLGGFWGSRAKGLSPSMRRYVFALTALSLLDAWLTTRDIYGIGELGGVAKSVVPLFFVLAGDFRYLVLLQGGTTAGEMHWKIRSVLSAVGLTLIVPISSQLIVSILPESMNQARVLFLVYEIGFFLLTLALLKWHPQLQKTPWLRRVSFFVLVYYGLWASADLIILTTQSDLGFALRVVPNVLYYGGLIAMIGRSAANGMKK